MEDEPDIEVAGTYTTAAAALRKLKNLADEKTPDLILLDSRLPAIFSRAVGYLLKESSLEQITEGIRTVVGGGASLDPGMARYLLVNQQHIWLYDEENVLSPRELEILTLLAEGGLICCDFARAFRNTYGWRLFLNLVSRL